MLDHRLKIARKAKKMTQEQLANKVQTTKGTISNYENGYSTPSNEMLVLLANTLNTTTDYLLGNTDNPFLPSQQEKDEAEFQAFANNPTLQKWYMELPKSKEEDLEKLRKMWEILKEHGEL
ncbi:helix-turn-helix domain-containing protein [Bacillus ndiopicus]|uniref:helix-turn-helix domain-containing protein n=1 Tax=Bacillus ndiopicus TaxID=1347368 RepID=UPI0005A90E53|nr:helix-turn-helix transcriptional regulator [Bacillus ndiopicus]